MSWLAPVVLGLLHVLYRLVLVLKSAFHSGGEPQALLSKRSKLPSHLALALVANPAADGDANEQYMLNSVEQVAGWCRAVGIRRLTVYDREGVLAKCSLELRERLMPPPRREEVEESTKECDIQYPLTPPPSDDAESRPLSPQSGASIPKLAVTTLRFPHNPSKPKRRLSVTGAALKRRRMTRQLQVSEPPLSLHIISYQSGKPAIAAAAKTILQDLRQSSITSTNPPSLPSLQELNAMLEGEHGFPSPDLMIVHCKPPVSQLRPPVELGGFPPWQTRLTEIYVRTQGSCWVSSDPCPPVKEVPSIREVEFRRALDEFARAEMRLGK
ncbi:hypothetical protein GY45DRAFT_1241152 [Cubamyces sp. BRFM 1775]|nr:hypothetical protein GY45DRAFT_1241152 [Cubamyces sp. BRFM 1775]